MCGIDAQARQVLDRLVRRAILAESDRIVGVDEDHAQPHERRHAQRIACVVRKGQERAAVGDESAVRDDAVEHRRHAEFAHPEMHIIAPGRRGT